ncbi:EthD domain-containing protein [Microbacterium sp. No. 7]|uniref:EthD domain-containing protein n=1 Tax=Microbacterium sp. No. 7 TaxID=1714373 RepID=UPI0006D0EF7B|nr:EthD domain-containing protein [Microbacterium sp. No. 7]ALJ21390.1 hypothetical protein AOA12_16395 [Microbacterium sp. No. 7]
MSSPAYKLTLLLKAREGLDPDVFADRWLKLEAADPLTAPGLVGHVFNRPLLGVAPIVNASSGVYDAAQETWWERKNDAADWFVSRAFPAWLALRTPLLAARPDAVGGQPNVIWEQAEEEPGETVKVITVPVARRSLTVGEFSEYWTGTHAELALQGPGTKERLVRLEDTPAQPTPSPFTKNRYDGVGAITFSSEAALAAEFDSDYYRNTLAPDESRFSDPVFSTVLVTRPVALL